MIAKKKQTDKKIEKREVPEYKIKIVADLADKMKKSRTVLIASTRGLPSSQFHEIKKNLRGKNSPLSLPAKHKILPALKLSHLSSGMWQV